jgi:hypothetical protein
MKKRGQLEAKLVAQAESTGPEIRMGAQRAIAFVLLLGRTAAFVGIEPTESICKIDWKDEVKVCVML